VCSVSLPEYVTDVPYLRGFSDDLSPLRLRSVAALNGFTPPPPDEFDYCELGAAQGDTTATLAAAYVRARFVGVDLNPEHVAVAGELARTGELANLRFLERDFESLGGEELPDFDYVTAHGVLSWIGPEKRRALLAWASAKLKPGGLLFVDYNALPAWAAVEPLRRLLVDRASAVQGDRLEQARGALELAKTMAKAGAAYFTDNPSAQRMLETMDEAGLHYVVHEYLHVHWVPMYFTDVAREMGSHDLFFVGQLPLFLNYRDLALPQPTANLFKGVDDRITLETLMGYALNQFFRREVYIKGKTARSDDTTRAFLESTPFGSPGPIAQSVRLPHYTLQFVGKVFDPLLPVLTEGAATVAELARVPSLRSFPSASIRDAVFRLLVAGLLWPMQKSTHRVPPPFPQRCAVPSAFNRMVLKRRLSSDVPLALASPVAGTGIPMTMLQRTALRLLTEAEPERRPEFISELLREQPFRFKIGKSPLEEPAERVLLRETERIRVSVVPKFIELGILEPA
jgi:SAM-dependent methyltransferase